MKPILIALLMVALAGCQNFSKNSDKNPGTEAIPSSAYTDVSNNIDQMAKDILSSIKTNNYASFSNYLSTKDSVLIFLESEFMKAGKSAKDIADFKEEMGKSYSKTLITTKTDFDYLIKKGTEQGIIWNDAVFDAAYWKLSKKNPLDGNFSVLALNLTIQFKYKGVSHNINFDNSESFLLIGSRWVLSGDFKLDDFTPQSAGTLELHSDNTLTTTDTSSSTMSDTTMPMDTRK